MAWMATTEALGKLPELLLRGRFSYTFDEVPLALDHLSLKKKANLLRCGIDSFG